MQESERLFRERAKNFQGSKVAILYPWPGAPYKKAIVGVGKNENDAVETLIKMWEQAGYKAKVFPIMQVHICYAVPDFKRQVMRVINPDNEKEVATFQLTSAH
jgi:hypothetical protein